MSRFWASGTMLSALSGVAVALVWVAVCGSTELTSEPLAAAQPVSPREAAQVPAPTEGTETTPASEGLLPPRMSSAEGPLQLVATSNIVGDWVLEVGGEQVEVSSLQPIGADPRTFQPSQEDIDRVAKADVIFSVGLGLEAAWLDELVRSAGANPARVVALGEVIDSVGDPPDPHFWLDPTRVTRAAREITETFDAASPDPVTGHVSYPVNWYFNNWKVYIQRLADLDFWIRRQLVEVPTERRVLPASLDSLQYFAEQYGFEIAEEGEGVPAVPSPQIVSLGERGGGADTYIRMMRTNVEAIVEALK